MSSSSGVGRVTGPITMLTVLALALGAVVAFTGWQPFADDDPKAVEPVKVNLASLTVADTNARLPRAARDKGDGATRGEVAHPIRTIAVFKKPGRKPFAKVRPREMGELWLPVVAARNGWSKVMLPSRPNFAAGWVQNRDVEVRTTPYEIKVHLGSRSMEIFEDGRSLGSWTVAIGAPATPTPTGRTFLLGLIQDPNQSYSEYILPLGTHSDTLDSYGGGPGTVAFHGWPDASIFGQAISHGCIRVPDDALDQLRQIPLGSLVSIDQA